MVLFETKWLILFAGQAVSLLIGGPLCHLLSNAILPNQRTLYRLQTKFFWEIF
jgi:hypothetical protein